MNILFEDEHIIVCEKIAGIPTQAGKITEKDMVSELNNYLKKSARDTSSRADLRIHLLHRLDKPVRGILVFAKNSSAAANINTQMQNNVLNKRYYALVEGVPAEKTACLENYMYKDTKLQKSFIMDEEARDTKLARLEYTVIDSMDVDKIFGGIKPEKYSNESLSGSSEFSLLDIKLITGRFHQIRCQLAEIGCPIVSDTLYGAKSALKNRKAIGLVAYSLEFNHPITGKRMSFTLPM